MGKPNLMQPDVMKPDVTQPNLMQTDGLIKAADSSDLKPQLWELINETMLNLESKLLNLVNEIKPAGQIRTDHLMEPAKPIEPTGSERLTGFPEHVNQTALDLKSRILRLVNETASADLMKPNESTEPIDPNEPQNSLKSRLLRVINQTKSVDLMKADDPTAPIDPMDVKARLLRLVDQMKPDDLMKPVDPIETQQLMELVDQQERIGVIEHVDQANLAIPMMHDHQL